MNLNMSVQGSGQVGMDGFDIAAHLFKDQDES